MLNHKSGDVYSQCHRFYKVILFPNCLCPRLRSRELIIFLKKLNPFYVLLKA